MFVTNQRIPQFRSIKYDNLTIECVNSFKLFGVSIDNKLNFNLYKLFKFKASDNPRNVNNNLEKFN